ncbi:MAG: DNA polymerase I [Clostridia bacterium]|nr:DNA polymerase I [Clostridia bacterium]
MPGTRGRKILIIDGHSLAHRAYHALPPTLTRADGTPTNAVLGFCNMVLKLLESEKPDAGVCAFDRPAPTFRHKEYEQYKATRKPMEDSLKVQIPIVREAAQALGLTVSELDGWEADDVIGTVSRLAEEAGDQAVIVTGDKDALQLVSDNVRVVLTKKGISEFEEYGPSEVRARFGFGPEKIPDFKGLMGDPSDNIPGVPGVGEKTAMRLVSQMGTVEEILAHVHEIKQEKLKNTLLENADVALASKRLATIDRDAPVNVDLGECCVLRRDANQLASFLRKQDFRTLLARLRLTSQPGLFPAGGAGAGSGEPSGAGGRLPGFYGAEQDEPAVSVGGGGTGAGAGPQSAEGRPVEIVSTADGITALAAALRAEGRFAFDVVRTGLRPITSRVEGLAFQAAGISAYVPVGDGDGRVSPAAASEAFGIVFGDGSVEKLCHDAKEKTILLSRMGCALRGVAFDSMIASYLADPGAPNAELCDVAERWVGVSVPQVHSYVEAEAKRVRDPQFCPGPEILAQMSCSCLGVMPELEAALLAALSSYGMEKLYREVEIPLVGVLADMEMTGIRIDSDRLRELSGEMQDTLACLAGEIYSMAGEEFNINSTKQLGHVLFEKLGLAPLKKTKTGYSTDAEVLEALSGQHEILRKLLDYRTVSKLKSTYVDALPELVNPGTGRIHTSFNQTVTATGRLSSTDPNLQNIPVRTEEGRKIRGVFIPGHDGWVLVSADYSQIELRVLAHMSQDHVLIESFLADEDIHRRTAAEVFGVPFDDVTPEMRSRAKAVNFGIVYGISDYGLSKNIGVSPREAKEFIERYFTRYRGVRNYMDSIVAQAKMDGYVTTLMNRRRCLPELTSPSMAVRKFAERVAMNTPIQGTAADIIKRAMVNVHARIADEKPEARLLLQVHDELVLEARACEAQEVADIVREEMSSAMQLSVPLRVDVSWGRTWVEAK